jgi:hypothetical protein
MYSKIAEPNQETESGVELASKPHSVCKYELILELKLPIKTPIDSHNLFENS